MEQSSESILESKCFVYHRLPVVYTVHKQIVLAEETGTLRPSVIGWPLLEKSGTWENRGKVRENLEKWGKSQGILKRNLKCRKFVTFYGIFNIQNEHFFWAYLLGKMWKIGLDKCGKVGEFYPWKRVVTLSEYLLFLQTYFLSREWLREKILKKNSRCSSLVIFIVMQVSTIFIEIITNEKLRKK